jgi:membrane protease YdiL (CAAX protease family)
MVAVVNLGREKPFSCLKKEYEERQIDVIDKNVVSPLAAILAVIASFFLIIFGGAASAILLGYGPTLIIGELLIILLPLSYMLLKHIDIKTYVGIEIKRATIVKGVVFGGILLLLDFAVAIVLTAIFGPSQAVEESNQLIADLSRSHLGLLYVAVGLFLAGVCEEFTFRAFLLNAINRKYSFLPALVISSLAFGLFHFDPQIVYIFSAFSLGLALGYVYYRYKSYVICAVAHSTLNLIILSISLLVIR